MAQTLRIMSANLLNGNADVEHVADLAAGLAVDVFVAQELTHDHAEVLSELLPCGAFDPDHLFRGMGVGTRRHADVERVPFTWGFGQAVRLHGEHWPGLGASLEIVNLHIAAPHMFRPAPGLWLRRVQMRELEAYLAGGVERGATEAGRVAGGAIQSADRPAPVSALDSDSASTYAARGGASASASTTSTSTAAAERCDSCGALGSAKRAGASVADADTAQAAAASSPRVLIGDFNATPIWPLYWRTASQFTDAAVEVARRRGSRLSPTWSPWPGMPKLFRIDHGFVRGLDVEEFKVFEVPGSDHSAIVMDLVLP